MVTVRVTVAVLTYLRPTELQNGLRLILEQVESINSNGGRYHVDVLIVDNDPEGSAESTVDSILSDLTRYAIEPRSGISAARNKALDAAADSRLLIFIDDDETPRPGWLSNLLTAWEAREPVAVAGRVVPEYEVPPNPWILAGRFFQRRSLPTGTRIDVAAAGNLLLDLEQVQQLGVRFDDRYGLTGGEDTLFSRCLVAKGGLMLWCDESIAVDKVPASRLNRRWVLRRAWSHGNSSGLIAMDMASSTLTRHGVRFQIAVGGVARVIAGFSRSLAGRLLKSTVHDARGMRMAFRGGGMLAAATGRIYHEYRRAG